MSTRNIREDFSGLDNLFVEVQNEAADKNWLVAIRVATSLLVRKPKEGRSRKHRKRLLVDHPFCKYCGIGLSIDTSTIDHVVPLCKGGRWNKDNLVLSCQMCNRTKADALLQE